MNKLIAEIEIMRVYRGLSKRSLAKSVDISEEYYWRIITGKAPGCSYTIIQGLCDTVGIKVLTYVEISDLKPNEKI